MIFEIEAEILGRLELMKEIAFKWQPYNVLISRKSERHFITLSKKLANIEGSIPLTKDNSGMLQIKVPPLEYYRDAIEILQHLESFGALDDKLTKIDFFNLAFRWIAESEDERNSPFNGISRKIEPYQHTELTEDWIKDTLIFKRQMGNLYIPFSFLRDGKIFYNEMRYQSAFCSFYMMLEYFFNEKGWGISKDAHKTKKCLNTALRQTLIQLPKHYEHYLWLQKELGKRSKKYNEEGLLFLLNRFRDEFSHANDDEKNRNLFKEFNYISISFTIMMVCNYVSIKKRLLPFVRKGDVDMFLESS